MVVQAEIWPARNVAEYAYCPRLFYLMEVEGDFSRRRTLILHARMNAALINGEVPNLSFLTTR